MVRPNTAEEGDGRGQVFGTDLVVLDTARRRGGQHESPPTPAVTPLREILKKPYYQAVVIQYLGNKKWRLGLVPVDGSKAQWAESIPFAQLLQQVAKLETNIKRIDHTSPEYRDYT